MAICMSTQVARALIVGTSVVLLLQCVYIIVYVAYSTCHSPFQGPAPSSESEQTKAEKISMPTIPTQVQLIHVSLT